MIDLTELVNRSVANLEDSSRYRTPIHSDIRPGCLIEGIGSKLKSRSNR